MTSKLPYSIFFLLISSLFEIQAQDLIKTKKQEEVNCKITKKTPDSIYYSYIDNNLIKEAALPMNNVQEYHYNYYSDSVSIKGSDPTNKKYEKLRLAANTGWGYRTAKTAGSINAERRKALEGLRSGLIWSFNADYFFNKSCGIGLKTSFFNTRDNFDGYYWDNTGISYVGNIQHDSKTLYIAPEFIWRMYVSDKKNSIWMGISLGYMDYYRTMNGDTGNLFSIYGGTLGGGLEVGYDFHITKKLGLGVSLYYEAGALIYYTVKTGNGYQYKNDDVDAVEGLSKIGVAFGFRFYN